MRYASTLRVRNASEQTAARHVLVLVFVLVLVLVLVVVPVLVLLLHLLSPSSVFPASTQPADSPV